MSAAEAVSLLIRSHKTVTTAESCTGGLIAYGITSVSGASECYNEGYVTYAVKAKERLLNVPDEVISRYGVVSKECAEAMANGARNAASADYALSSTGIAGPTGGDETHPVGLVYLACAGENGTIVERHIFSGERTEVQRQAADAAIELLLSQLK